MTIALQLCVPAAHFAIANKAMANLGLGPGFFSVPLRPVDAPDPTVATCYAAHWASAGAGITAAIEQMIGGIVPTNYINEYDIPATCQWGVDDIPSEADVIEAMRSIAYRRKPYDTPEAYDVGAQWAGFLALDNLTDVQAP